MIAHIALCVNPLKTHEDLIPVLDDFKSGRGRCFAALPKRFFIHYKGLLPYKELVEELEVELLKAESGKKLKVKVIRPSDIKVGSKVHIVRGDGTYDYWTPKNHPGTVVNSPKDGKVDVLCLHGVTIPVKPARLTPPTDVDVPATLEVKEIHLVPLGKVENRKKQGTADLRKKKKADLKKRKKKGGRPKKKGKKGGRTEKTEKKGGRPQEKTGKKEGRPQEKKGGKAVGRPIKRKQGQYIQKSHGWQSFPM